jgi:hypothetical protein
MGKVARTASILCGVLFLSSLGNVAFAVEAKDEVLKILREALPTLQSTMSSMSQGCTGGGRACRRWAGQPGKEPAMRL